MNQVDPDHSLLLAGPASPPATRRRRRAMASAPVRALAVIALAAAVLVTVPAGAASAAKTCRGSTCNHGDPQVYGCSADAFTLADLKSSDLRLIVELRYSGKCDAAWARVTYDGQNMDGATGNIASINFYNCADANSTCLKGYYTSGSVVHDGQTKWSLMRQFTHNWVRACAYARQNECTSAF